MIKKSWTEKLKETDAKGGIRKQTDKGLMYISKPSEIARLIKKIPKGKLTTTKLLAEKLSKKYKVDFTCPMTTGIFTSVVANTVEEELEKGKKLTEVTPYWRVVKEPKGYIYDKYLGLKSKQKKYLSKEGFKFVPSGTKQGPVVKDVEKYLV
ncbi:MAG: MGMT family protein [Candidatus Dojkabacteria bacterium]|nr:MGMT family protein [Candidatus Dojkabacteria bacterium]